MYHLYHNESLRSVRSFLREYGNIFPVIFSGNMEVFLQVDSSIFLRRGDINTLRTTDPNNIGTTCHSEHCSLSIRAPYTIVDYSTPILSTVWKTSALS